MIDRPARARRYARRFVGAAALGCVITSLAAACGGPSSSAPVPSASAASTPRTAAPSTSISAPPPASSSGPAGTSTTPTRHRRQQHHTTPSTAASSPSSTSATTASSGPPPSSTPASNGSRPVIVLDPGHSPTVHATDPKTGLDVSDYENDPEMGDVFRVAVLVRRQLRADGYRVVMTKSSADTPESLGARAHLANRVHADLALSIHDQAGSNGGIGFDAGNNIVYYQSVGTYRETPAGKKVYFTDRRLAAVSKRYGKIFADQRSQAQGTEMQLQGDTGYDLGTRGLAPGDIWIVQLLSHVPWIYNEAGGNSAGMSGLDPADEHTYAAGLVASVERCVPVSP